MKYFAALLLILTLSAPVHASLSVVWIMDAEPVPQIVKDRLHELGVEWVILNRRLNKLMIDAVIPTKEIAVALRDYLVENDYSPILVGVWKYDGLHDGEEYVNTGTEEEPVWEVQGVPAVTFRPDLYLAGMPDDCTGDPPVCVRPSEAREVHKFAGWPMRRFE